MAATAAPGATVVMRHTFKAPVAKLFRAWSDPAMAKRWSWGPEFDTVSIDLNCHPGGTWRQHIRDHNTGESWFFDGVFQEVVSNRKLVHTFHFTNDRGYDEPPSLVTIEFTATTSALTRSPRPRFNAATKLAPLARPTVYTNSTSPSRPRSTVSRRSTSS